MQSQQIHVKSKKEALRCNEMKFYTTENYLWSWFFFYEYWTMSNFYYAKIILAMNKLLDKKKIYKCKCVYTW